MKPALSLSLPTLCVILNTWIVASVSADWNQFRGPNGSGVAKDAKPPVVIEADQAEWITALPAGFSSPVLIQGKVFITGIDEGRLSTWALDGDSGEVLWKRHAPRVALGLIHSANSHASSTPCADESGLYVYFGSFGLVCYDHQGDENWTQPIPTPKSMYGMSTSPILYDNRVILVLDDDENLSGSSLSRSKVVAFDKGSGKQVWETPRPYNRSSWSTPMIWRHTYGEDLVVLGNGRAYGYHPDSGLEKWYVDGFAREPIALPIAGDSLLYLSASMQGGIGDQTPDPEPFWNAVLQFDQNQDQRISKDEISNRFTVPIRPELPLENPGFGIPLPSNPAERFKRQLDLFNWRDKNKDGLWTKEEYLSDMIVGRGRPFLAALRPGGEGDVSETHLAWSLRRGIPEIPSPIYFKNRLYLLRDGGLLSCVDAGTGEEIYRERLGASGQYRASPVIAGEKLYLVSAEGILTVVQTGDAFKIIHQTDLGQPVTATPAIGKNQLLIRTHDSLMSYLVAPK